MYTLTPSFRIHEISAFYNHSPCRAALTTRPSAAVVSTVPAQPSSDTIPITLTSSAVDDPSSLRSTWTHRAWVTSGFATVLAALAKSAAAAADTGSITEPLLAALLGYVLADVGSGVYHWAIDNYGGPSTPVFGSQIDAFQGHHRRPWTITRRQFANNLHALARAATFAVLPLEVFIIPADAPAAAHALVGVSAGCVMLSQQFHAWAHEKKRRLPAAVVALQGAGLLVSPAMHGRHHREPYNNNYCIVSGIWNGWLDESKVFEVLEMVIFFKLGVRPRSWSETRPEWMEVMETTEMS